VPKGFRLDGNAFAVTALVLLSWPGIAFAPSSFEDGPPRIVVPVRTSPDSPLFSPQLDRDSDEQARPNGVSTSLAAGSLGSFDYSSFVTAAMLAGISQASEFGQGSKGTAVIIGTRWSARPWKLFHGSYCACRNARRSALLHAWPWGFLKRTGYAVSRVLVTRTDSGRRTLNISEIAGNGAGAGIPNLYYPSRERTWTKTGQKWATQVSLDGVFNIVKGFWPDVNHLIFLGKY
jgi:hypothetical protein